MRLWVEPAVIDEIARLPGHVRQRVRRAVRDLPNDPRPAQSRALDIPAELQVESVEARRLRMDQWRVIYVIDGELERSDALPSSATCSSPTPICGTTSCPRIHPGRRSHYQSLRHASRAATSPAGAAAGVSISTATCTPTRRVERRACIGAAAGRAGVGLSSLRPLHPHLHRSNTAAAPSRASRSRGGSRRRLPASRSPKP